MKRLAIGLSLVVLLGVAAAANAQLINEIRTDNSGADTDEYFELSGTPGMSLTGLTYIVIGDNTAGTCGVVECVVPLSSYSIQADGLLAVVRAASGMVLTGYDVTNVTAIAFENSDNVTHMLVSGFTGTLNQDLDTNNDGVLDITPWTSVLDCVALVNAAAINCVAGVEYVYCSTQVGPDGTFHPGHVYRCGTSWLIGPFGGAGLSGVTDTPGGPNNCPVPTLPSTWTAIKSQYR